MDIDLPSDLDLAFDEIFGRNSGLNTPKFHSTTRSLNSCFELSAAEIENLFAPENVKWNTTATQNLSTKDYLNVDCNSTNFFDKEPKQLNIAVETTLQPSMNISMTDSNGHYNIPTLGKIDPMNSMTLNWPDALSPENEILKLRQEIAFKDARIQAQDHENRCLKRALRKSLPLPRRNVEGCDDLESMGENIFVSRAFLDYTRFSYCRRPSFFVRRLIFDSKIFSLEEIASSSMTGKACSSSPTIVRPPLDPIKLKVIKDFTMANCKIDDEEFTKIVRQIPSDARKRLKSQNSSGKISFRRSKLRE